MSTHRGSLRGLHEGLACALALLATAAVASPAQAQRMAAAARAFADAQTAELAEEPARAAELYEMADRLVPSPEAARSAARMRAAAGDEAIAATRAEALLERYPDDETSRALAEEILAERRDALGRLELRCADPCGVEIDGRASGVEPRARHLIYVHPGPHEIVATFGDDASAARPVEATAGALERIELERPEPPPEPVASAAPPDVDRVFAAPGPAPDASDGGVVGTLDPFFFAAGAIATGAVGGVLAWSAVDTRQARDAFVADPEATHEDYQDGLDRELRTNVLIAGTATLGLATAVLAIFTDWDGEPDAPVVALGVGPGRLGLSLTGRLR